MLLYREVVLLMIFAGILMIVVELSKINNTCPKNKIIYKYIPRTLEEEEESSVYVTDIFKTMFSQPSPWIAGRKDEYKMKDVVLSQ